MSIRILFGRLPRIGASALLVLATAVAAASIAVLSPPAAPTDVTAEDLGSGVARVTWSDNSSDEAGFDVQRESQKGNGSWFKTTTIATVGADMTSVDDEAGTGTYRYRVRAFNASGDSAWSAWAEVTLAGGGGGGGSTELMWTNDAFYDYCCGVWEDAMAEAESHVEGGHDDWRLPTLDEAYASIFDGSWGTDGTRSGTGSYWSSEKQGNWAYIYIVTLVDGVPLPETFETERVWRLNGGRPFKAVRP